MQKANHYYDLERRRGRTASAILHLVFLLISILGLPSFLTPTPPEEPLVISVDILPITGITNVKPSNAAPAEDIKPEVKESKKPSPPVKVDKDVPAPPPEPSPSELKKEKAEALKKAQEEKKKKEEEKKRKEKPKEDDLAAVLKAVKETAQKEKKDKKKDDPKDTSTSKSNSQNYNPSLPMSMSEKDAIMSQIQKCWTVPAGAKNAQNLVILLNAEYNKDGSLIRVEMSRDTQAKVNNDSFFRAAAESAMRAVKQCYQLQGLPPEKYETWHFIELQFDPKNMLN